MNKEEALTAVRIIVDELPVLDALTIVMDCQSYLTDQYAATLQGAEADAVKEAAAKVRDSGRKNIQTLADLASVLDDATEMAAEAKRTIKKTRLTLICSGVTLMINVIALVIQIVIKVLPHL